MQTRSIDVYASVRSGLTSSPYRIFTATLLRRVDRNLLCTSAKEKGSRSQVGTNALSRHAAFSFHFCSSVHTSLRMLACQLP